MHLRMGAGGSQGGHGHQADDKEGSGKKTIHAKFLWEADLWRRLPISGHLGDHSNGGARGLISAIATR